MSDRDELAELIHGHFCGCDDPKCSDFGGASYDAASDIRDLGFRRNVTPEQIEAAARAVQKAEADCDYRIDLAHYECGNNRRPPTLVTWESLPSEERNHYLANASVAARAFGLAPEDVTR